MKTYLSKVTLMRYANDDDTGHIAPYQYVIGFAAFAAFIILPSFL